jgi:hypothetical protein
MPNRAVNNPKSEPLSNFKLYRTYCKNSALIASLISRISNFKKQRLFLPELQGRALLLLSPKKSDESPRPCPSLGSILLGQGPIPTNLDKDATTRSPSLEGVCMLRVSILVS